MCAWSTSPAARKSRSVVGPPPMRTSWPLPAPRGGSGPPPGGAPGKRGGGEPGGREGGGGGWPPPDASVLAARRVAGRLERLCRRRVEEVEGRAALHLDRRGGVVGEDEYRGVGGGLVTPTA